MYLTINKNINEQKSKRTLNKTTSFNLTFCLILYMCYSKVHKHTHTQLLHIKTLSIRQA